MPRRILVLANPIAGRGRARTLVPELLRQLADRGCAAEAHFTTGRGDAAARAAAAGTEDWDALVAVGGDGTVNEVLNGMPDPSRPLGVLPLGTANVLACELRLPWDPATAARAFAGGRQRPLAIGLANGRRFLLFCGAGVDAAVVQRMAAAGSKASGKRKWIGPILHVARHWPRFSLRAVLADGLVIDELAAVLVTRVRNYGGVLRLPPAIDVDAELLHVLAFRGRSRPWWIWQGLRGALGLMRPGRRLLLHSTTSLRIEGTAPFQVDGDLGGDCPVDVTLLPQRANLLVPE